MDFGFNSSGPSGGGGGGIGGSGTTNYVSKFTTSGTIGNSQIFDNGTNVGINTILPTAKLDILGIDILSTSFSLKIKDSVLNNLLSVRNDGFVFVGSSAKDSYLWTESAGGQLGFSNSNGSASIYASAPKLFMTNGGSGSNVFAQINTSNGNWYIGNLNTDVNTSNLTNTKLQVRGIDATSSNFALKVENSASTPLLYVSNKGNIGNLTTPATDIQFFMAGNGTNTYGYYSNGAFGVSNFCGAGGTHRTHFYSVNGGQSGFEIDFTNTIAYNRHGIYLDNTGVNSSNNIGVRINVANGANNYALIVNNGLSGFGTLTPTEKLSLVGGNFSIDNGGNIVLGTTTGTKIGTSTSQKLAFYNSTPIVQPPSVTTSQGIADTLTNLGLLAPGSILNGTIQNLNSGQTQWSTTAPLTTLLTGATANGFAFFTDLGSKVVAGTTTYDEYFISAGRTLTLTGTSGTANINILGVNYLATFVTDLTTTANNFVTAHQATLLALGIQVYANLGVLKFGKKSDAAGGSVDLAAITITTLTGNLSGTFGTTINDHLVIPYAGKPYFGERLNHAIRVNFNIVLGNTQTVSLQLRRWQNDTVIGSEIPCTRNNDVTGVQEVFISYTAGATDPFVTGGFYFALSNNTGTSIEISGNAGILIQTSYQQPTNF